MLLNLKEFFLNLDPSALPHKVAEYYSNVAHDLPSAVKILKEMGFTGKALVRNYKGEEYIVLSGYAGLRTILTGTRYKAANIKIVDMVIGKAGVAKSALEGTGLTVVLVAAADIFEYVMNDTETLADLGVQVATDLTKAAIAGIVGYAVGALLATTSIAAGIAILPLAGAVAVGIAVGLGLDYVDQKLEITKRLQKYVNDQVGELQLSFSQGMRNILIQLWNMSTVGTPAEGIPSPY
jgi:hypothetical protein